MPPQKHGRSCRTSSTFQHHSPGGCPGDCDLQLHSRPYYASAGSGEERESRECVCTNITTHIRLLDTFSRPPMNPSQTQVSTTSSSRPSFPSK